MMVSKAAVRSNRRRLLREQDSELRKRLFQEGCFTAVGRSEMVLKRIIQEIEGQVGFEL